MNNRFITIGSGGDCDIRIDDPSIAEIHGIMSVDGDMLCLELTPGCMAFLNDNQVEGKYWLQDTDIVVIGMVRLDLSLIHRVFTEGLDPNDVQLYNVIDSNDDLIDAVVVKHNWWPTIIVGAIIIAVAVFSGLKIKKYHDLREKQRNEIQLKQDSILLSKQKIDSLNNAIEQFIEE